MPKIPPPVDPAGLAARLGLNLRRLREAAGLTQAALAERAGLTQGRVADLERGNRTATWPVAVRLACALGAPVGELAAPDAAP